MGCRYLFADVSSSDAPDDHAVQRWLQAAALVGAAGLIGFGIVLWIAANWDDFGKLGRFAIVASSVGLSALAAAALQRARAGASLTGVLAIGGLLALTGQTYQTGADPWQLFAIWAALALPWALAARHDAVWALWVAVAATAIPLWGHSEMGIEFLQRATAVLPMWLASLAVCGLVSPTPRLARWTGETKWSFRLAVAMAVILVSTTAVAALFTGSGAPAVYLLGLVLIIAGAAAFAMMSPFDLPLLAATTLALDALLICGFSKSVLYGRETFGQMLLIGLVSAGIVAASAVALLRIAAIRNSGEPAVASGAPVAPAAIDEAGRTWPIAVLSGVGAIIASIPLLGFLFMLFGSLLERGIGTWIGGMAVLAATVPWLQRAKPLGFGQQFGVISLAIGGVLMGMASYRDLGVAPASLVMLAVCAGLAALVPIGWVRGLLGAGAAAFTSVLVAQILDDVRHMPDVGAFRLAWLLIGAGGAGALLAWAGDRGPLSTFITGWSALALLGLMLAAGQTFLVGPHLGFGGTTLGTKVGSAWMWNATRILSLAAALTGAGLLLFQRPELRTPAGIGTAAAAAALSAFTPSLGAAVLLFTAAVLTGRRTIALMASLACLWIVGSFYYWLGWPLVNKAYLLIGIGSALALICWVSGMLSRLPTVAPSDHALAHPVLAAGLIAASVAATGAMVGSGVRSMERILTEGRTVMIPLAPVDPRSLMQGDYMALRFALPATPEAQTALRARSRQLSAIVSLDARGAGSVTALTPDQPPLQPNQVLVGLAWRGGRWALGTNGFYFKEGTAERFAPARFGIFRVASDGRALLTGLADESLKPL